MPTRGIQAHQPGTTNTDAKNIQNSAETSKPETRGVAGSRPEGQGSHQAPVAKGHQKLVSFQEHF